MVVNHSLEAIDHNRLNDLGVRVLHKMHFILRDRMRADRAVGHLPDEQNLAVRSKIIAQLLGGWPIFGGIIDVGVKGRGAVSHAGQAAFNSLRCLASFLRIISRLSRDRWSMNRIPSRWSISCCRQVASSPVISSSWALPSRSSQRARMRSGRSTSAYWSGTDRQPSV